MSERLRRIAAFLEPVRGYRRIVSRTTVLEPGAKTAIAAPEIQDLVGRVDEERLRNTVERLAAESRHPRHNPEHHAGAARDIVEAFCAAGLAVREQRFAYHHLRGRNIIAGKPGRRSGLPPLLVCAHYDSVKGSPGADDNASGVAAMLECARILAGAAVPRGIEFAALDMEEVQERPGEAGLLGSSALARAAKRQGTRYAGVYNLEMVGYSAGPGGQRLPAGSRWVFRDAHRRVRIRDYRGDGLGAMALGKGKRLNRRVERAATRWVPELPVVPVDVPSWLPIPDLLRSDHTSFWLAGMAATTLTDTANFRNPHYHRPTDTPDTLDYRLVRLSTQLLVATVAQHASEA